MTRRLTSSIWPSASLARHLALTSVMASWCDTTGVPKRSLALRSSAFRLDSCASYLNRTRLTMSDVVRAERTGPTPTITRPDVERDQRIQPKALRPHKVVVLDCQCHT